MAVLKAPRNTIAPQIPVDVYRDGKLSESYVSVSECARALGVSYQTVKYLIANGKELPSVPYSITLDIPFGCPYSYVLVEDDESGRFIPVVRDDRTGELII